MGHASWYAGFPFCLNGQTPSEDTVDGFMHVFLNEDSSGHCQCGTCAVIYLCNSLDVTVKQYFT